MALTGSFLKIVLPRIVWLGVLKLHLTEPITSKTRPMHSQGSMIRTTLDSNKLTEAFPAL